MKNVIISIRNKTFISNYYPEFTASNRLSVEEVMGGRAISAAPGLVSGAKLLIIIFRPGDIARRKSDGKTSALVFDGSFGDIRDFHFIYREMIGEVSRP